MLYVRPWLVATNYVICGLSTPYRNRIMGLKILFHLFGAIQFFYGCYYEVMYVKFPPEFTQKMSVTPFGGKLKYLTFLDAIVQTIYFTVALLNDVFGNNENNSADKPLIRRLKDALFSTIAFPLSMFVATSFWSIYAVDRELILPRVLDSIFPGWLNHIMHTNIAIFTLIELVTSFRMYPKRSLGLSILSVFMLCYLFWIHIIYFNTGHWVYPILAIINWPLKIIFYVFSFGLVCGLYTLGERINRVVWSKEIDQTVRAGKKKAK